MENTRFWREVERTVSDEVALWRERAEAKQTELANLQHPTHKVDKPLYGFLLEVEEEVNYKPEMEKLDLTIQKHKSISKSQVSFAERLQSFGLNPLAVLPIKLWEGLCQKFGLLRFEHLDTEGKTAISAVNKKMTETVGNMLDIILLTIPLGLAAVAFLGSSLLILPILAISWTLFVVTLEKIIAKKRACCIAGICASILAAVLLTPYPDGTRWVGLLAWNTFADVFKNLLAGTVAAVIALFVNFLVVGFVFLERYGSRQSLLESAAKCIAAALEKAHIKRMSRDKLMRYLWPENHDYEDGEKIAVRFANPPDQALLIIKKLQKANLKPFIAVVPEAVNVDMSEAINARKEEIKKLNLDPIIYFRDCDNVAVLGHFGSFAKEEEVIEWVKKEGLQICFN